MWRATTERWIIQQRGGASSSAFLISTVPLAFYLCLPLSSNCLHNHLLTLISPSFPLFVFYTSPLFSAIPPATFNATLPLFPVCLLWCFLSYMPTGTLAFSAVPLPSTGEWSLITVHGLYDEMPLAHLTSSCQLPLTSHCLCALQTASAGPKFFTSPGCDGWITSLKTLFGTVSLFITNICHTSDDGAVLYGGEHCCLQS